MENKITQTGTAKVIIGDDSYDLPIMKGSMGAAGIDVRAIKSSVFSKAIAVTATPWR